ncbi:MAG: type II toxin-antitoxin system RelE/ParE family toxin [Okeania sp. SIO3I5]|uniref:type II toxin-antitoxin system RelE/ParE family toxin n=1 Tax=Okeania sp. SIO3I5 TaxID=2607805 RepID=UPI0013BB0B0C|nr:type II toxin-antitoxin system RelE/ParE family toxin [Okeania sp. SIO3I5]NEQ38116.1 type II toxin-antitoxin system RelE/ParE family toxin [Okeania sp. SIO3I5]
MKYRVEITDVALAEAEEVYVWIMDRFSPESAQQWFEGLMDAIESLNKSPKRFSLAPENDVFPEEIRQVLYGKGRGMYRILFTISESIVYILHVRHASRQFIEP